MNCIKCNKEHDGIFGSGKYCSRSCANSRIFSIVSNDKRKISNSNKVPWNKGLRSNWTQSKCIYCGNDLLYPNHTPKKYHLDCWKKSSGGDRRGSGRGKSGWYKGYWCDSSWELAWVVYNLENSIPFDRNTIGYEYQFNGRKCKYYPDFIIGDTFYEIKGRLSYEKMDEKNKEKISQFKEKLIVLYKSDMCLYINYTTKKYGKNYTYLYD